MQEYLLYKYLGEQDTYILHNKKPSNLEAYEILIFRIGEQHRILNFSTRPTSDLKFYHCLMASVSERSWEDRELANIYWWRIQQIFKAQDRKKNWVETPLETLLTHPCTAVRDLVKTLL